MAKKYPGMRAVETSPNKIHINVSDSLIAQMGLELSFCAAVLPKSDLGDLTNFASVMFAHVVQELDVDAFTRIGLRLVYDRRFESRKEAAEFVLSQTPLPRLRGKRMGVEGTQLDPEIAVRYEGETTGFHVRLKSEEVTMSSTPPAEFRDALPANVVRSFGVLDVDYYALGVTSAASFNAAAIIESWSHVLRRDLPGLFDGQ
jgi:hypothetical protein